MPTMPFIKCFVFVNTLKHRKKINCQNCKIVVKVSQYMYNFLVFVQIIFDVCVKWLFLNVNAAATLKKSVFRTKNRTIAPNAYLRLY